MLSTETNLKFIQNISMFKQLKFLPIWQLFMYEVLRILYVRVRNTRNVQNMYIRILNVTTNMKFQDHI